MAKPTVIYPDPESAAVDLATDLLADQPCTVTIGKPKGWTVDSPLYVQVAWDGTPRLDHPVASYPTIRFTVWGRNTGPVKDLAALAMGLVLAESGYQPLLGVQPSRDPDTGAELASFTVRRTNRSQPITTLGS